MRKKSTFVFYSLAVGLACSSPSFAQADPLTRFLDGMFKRDTPRPEAAPTEQSAPAPIAPAERAPTRAAPKPPAVPQPRAASSPSTLPSQPQPQRVETGSDAVKPAASPEKAKSKLPAQAVKPVAAPSPRSEASASDAAAPAKASVVPVRAAAPTASSAQPVPTSPAAALERVNGYFNSIDQMTASFVQTSANGQRAEGTLSMRRPGQLHFAYSPPSSLEIVSDGRSVAIRDKKLGTNDVYSIRQTPLKFLVQDQVDLAKDTKVQDVQIGSDGIITVRFEDSATLGGTSKITLRFDARANALRQWTVIDAQGYETTVALSGLNVVRRTSAEVN
ncbi:outer membrane lipoprotein carrier protein LolA [Microvirga subterranea]|uniref:outer membrane lipoprotein carrier protein LolA n=1 Tax=Microvirga subterranea TaxID=186651 RepID=UPI0014767567|nr:outer membrane lipoprotein carrier protein LolA [Microvirga subterranea]